MNYKFYHIFILTLAITFFAVSLVAQGGKKKNTRIRVEYVKDHDDSEKLVATLRIKEERYIPFEGAVIHFYNVLDSSKVLLAKIAADEEGQAIYALENTGGLLRGPSGNMNFEVGYEGSSSTLAHKRELEVKQVKLTTSFLQENDIKFIAIDASEIETDDTNTPIEDVEITIFIKGTFSLLQIDQKETDKNGRVMAKFPVDMPGDTAGVLTIVTKILEHDLYGNVESRGDINWGKPVPLSLEKHRGLGDTDAPLWMVYTLIILLSIVWSQYLYVSFLIFKIKKARRIFAT